MNTQSDEQDSSPMMGKSPRKIPTYIGRSRRRDRSLVKDIKESVKEALSMNNSRKHTSYHTPTKHSVSKSIDLDNYHVIQTERDEEITDTRLEMQTQRTEADELRSNINKVTAETVTTTPDVLSRNHRQFSQPERNHDPKSTIFFGTNPHTLAELTDPALTKTASSSSQTRSKSGFSQWKKVKVTLNAVKFQAGTQALMNKKVEEIMKGKNELDSYKKQWRVYLDPDSTIKAIWDTIIALTLIYHCFVTPFLWGMRMLSEPWKITQLALDGVTVLDMILMFLTGIPKRNKVVSNYRVIARKYLRRKFTFDLIACLPFYLWNKDLLVLKLLRCIHLGRITVLARNFLSRKTRKGLVLVKYLNFLYAMYFILHLLICAWIYLGKADFSEKPTWFAQLQHQQRFNVPVYINSAFFIITTAATVGYGDIVPENKLEMLICMIFEFCGILVVAICQGKILQILQTETQLGDSNSKAELDMEKWLFEKEKAKMNFVNSEESVILGGAELVVTMNEIQGYFRAHRAIDYRGILNGFGFFEHLGPEIQDQTIKIVFKDCLKKFHIFFDMIDDFAFTREFISGLNPRAFYPFQKIIKRGTSSKGIYLILKGDVLITYENVALLTIPEHSYFGDNLLLDRNSNLNFIAGHMGARCLFMSKGEFMKLCSRYPHVLEALQSVAYRRNEHFREKKNEFQSRFKKSILGMILKSPDHKENGVIGEEVFTKTFEDIEANMVPPERPASQFKKKWAEDGFQLRIIAADEDQEDKENSDVVYVNDISIPEGLYENNDNKESCNFNTVIEANPDAVPKFPKETFLANQSQAHNNKKESCCDYAGTVHANMIPKFFFDTASHVFGHKKQNYSINIHLDDTVDIRPSPSQIDDFFQALAKRRKSLLDITNESPSMKKIMDLTKAIEEDVDSDPNTSCDSGDYESDSSQAGSEYSISDDGSDELNNSLEVPIEVIPPNFEDVEQLEYIVDFLEKKIEIFNYKIDNLSKVLRHDSIDEWKKLRKFRNQNEPGHQTHRRGEDDLKTEHDERIDQAERETEIAEQDIEPT